MAKVAVPHHGELGSMIWERTAGDECIVLRDSFELAAARDLEEHLQLWVTESRILYRNFRGESRGYVVFQDPPEGNERFLRFIIRYVCQQINGRAAMYRHPQRDGSIAAPKLWMVTPTAYKQTVVTITTDSSGFQMVDYQVVVKLLAAIALLQKTLHLDFIEALRFLRSSGESVGLEKIIEECLSTVEAAPPISTPKES